MSWERIRTSPPLCCRWGPLSIWTVLPFINAWATVFLAACANIQLTLGQMVLVVVTATLASIGTAGVSGAGMVMLAMVLQSVNIPVEGIALVAGIDRILTWAAPPSTSRAMRPAQWWSPRWRTARWPAPRVFWLIKEQ